jgi:integrase/recombinase XerC/integrase/recombinase XerD
MVWVSLRLYISEFIQARDVALSTRYAYARNLHSFDVWCSEKKNVLTRNDIIAYKNWLIENGYTVRAINNYLTTVKTFFKWLKEQDVYEDIARDIKKLRVKKGFNKDILSVDAIKQLLTSIDRATKAGMRDYAIICMMIYTGLRCIEIIRLDTDDIHSKRGHMVAYIHGKGSFEKDSFVIIPPALATILRDFINDDNMPLFTSLSSKNYGSRLTTRSISRIIKNRLRAINVNSNRLTAHSLRHTAITLSLIGGATLQEACVMARHADINTTLIYAQNLDRINNAAEYKISNYLGQLIGIQ